MRGEGPRKARKRLAESTPILKSGRSAEPKAGGLRALALLALSVVLALAGCGGGGAAASSNSSFSVAPGTGAIDTNCTGCNATNSSGTSIEQFSATLSGGGAASVTWAVSGGDANSGAGTISASGQYTPPSYLTANSVQVTVTATLNSNTSVKASAALTVTPGFLQPLTPENVSVGSAGTVTITGYIAEAGGTSAVNYALASTASGSGGGLGTLGTVTCTRGALIFTHCAVTYTAPATVTTTGATYVVATVDTSTSKEATVVLLNAVAVSSNPATHQTLQTTTPIALGTSGGNNNDYDTSGNQIKDCCSGTLGSLIQDSSNKQYLLSNNHVLARSDQAKVGDIIVQPGLIDNNCVPFGLGSGTAEVGSLTGWLALKSNLTNADAAIAQVNAGAVNTSGAILELGARQTNGTLAAAPPGTSSTGGKGEAGTINMVVAKSGRTTGLTCASVSTVSLNVQVSYYTDCAETTPYYTKTYTNQLGITGNQFSDAGDSGSLVVDTANAEPVGLFFAGGLTLSGTSEGVANPVGDVLSELSTQVGGGTSYTFVGTTDHTVSCLNYGNATATAAQGFTLSSAENARVDEALTQARALVNPATGILGVAPGKSSDHAGEGAVIVYVDQNMNVSVPVTVGGVRTAVIPTTAQAVAYGTTPRSMVEVKSSFAPLRGTELSQAIATKQTVAQNLMQQNPAFFGVGVGQSLDNPSEAALVVYVDRDHVPAQLFPIIEGLRVRYVIMERFHVTRSYATGTGLRAQSHCMPQGTKANTDLLDWKRLSGVGIW